MSSRRADFTSDTPDRLPPHSVEAEQGVLGCCLSSAEQIDACSQAGLAPEWFYDLRHRTLWESISEMREDRKPIDLLSIGQRLRDTQQIEGLGGLAYLSELIDCVPNADNAPYYLGILREKFQLRRVLSAATGIVSQIYSDTAPNADLLLESAEKSILSARDLGRERDQSASTSKSAVTQFIDHLQDRCANIGKLSGIETGFRRLDHLLDGIQLAELTLVAARPSIGKTALGTRLATHAAITNRVPTLFVTAEMSNRSLVRRMISDLASVPMSRLRDGDLTESDHRHIITQTAALSHAPLFFEELIGGAPISKVCSLIRAHVRKNGVKLVIIDYIQKITSDREEEKRTYEIANVSGKLQALTRETGVAIVALAQLNRENEKGKGRTPGISDLADSKQLEQDADTVILLHRKREEVTGEAQLIIGKQRDGECTTVKLGYNGIFCRFTESAPDIA